MKKLIVLIYSSIVASFIFAVLNVVFRLDIAFFAFPLSILFVAVLAFYAALKLIKNNDATKIPLVKKLYQYIPFVLLISFVLRRAGEFGTAKWFDWISVLLWLVVSVLSIVIQLFLGKKTLKKINPQWEEIVKAYDENKPKGIARVFREILEWVDAFVQAAFTVALLNIFIIQLYQIPSESMVPEFLVNDRVVVFKTASGPKFPLSDVGLPTIKKYDRGDIVVFRNPHYSKDRKSEVKSFVSQLLYTITFTMVNLNVDEEGNLKADPLVKRICGLPGEQLVMQDGVLYARTFDSLDFKPVTEDSLWAEWNLDALPQDIKKDIQYIPLKSKSYNAMIECETLRKELSYSQVQEQVLSLVNDFTSLSNKLFPQKLSGSAPSLKKTYAEELLFSFSTMGYDVDFARRLLSTEGGVEEFKSFMTQWIEAIPEECFSNNPPLVGGDIYSDANFRLNLMVKLGIGGLIVRNSELLLDRIPVQNWGKDTKRIELINYNNMLINYLSVLDLRNMPLFPANNSDGSPEFISENTYFMMGDNRFNSLDMRHSYDKKFIALTALDEYSVYYFSNMAPQGVASKDILGTTVLRFWPTNRFGVPGLTGKVNIE